MPNHGAEIIDQYDRLRQRDGLWHAMWQDAIDLIIPQRESVYGSSVPGEKKTLRLHDASAPHANVILAAFLVGGAINRATKWMRLRLRDPGLNKRKDVAEWLELSRDVLLDYYAESNFYSQAHEFYLDAPSIGTGCMFVGEAFDRKARRQRLWTKTFTVGQYVVEEDHFGNVVTLLRRFKYTGGQAVKQFGPDRLSRKVIEAAEKSLPDQFEFIHRVVPRENSPQEGPLDIVPGPDQAWASEYVEVDTKEIVDEGGFNEFPYMVFRWSKTTGEVYGRGPGFTAMPDIRQLNVLVEDDTVARQKAMDPPLWATSDAELPPVINMTPNGVNYAKSRESVWHMENRARFDVVQVKKDDLQESIRKIFMVNLILDITARRAPMMTATEVIAKLEKLQELIGPAFGRNETEFLNPFIERTFNQAFRGGLLPPPPDVLLEEGADIDVEYEGPLARSQRRQDLDAIRETIQDVIGLAQVQQDVLDNYDFDAIARHSPEITGMPMRFLRDKEEVAELRAARTEAREQQAQMAQMSAMAEAAGRAAPAIKELGKLPAGAGV